MNPTLRSLTKSPGFTAAAVLTLALGIGANTAIFTIVNSVLLRPLPFPDSEQLVQIWQKTPKGEPLMARGPNFKYWRDEATLLDGIAALDPQSATATGGGEPERLQGYEVSASYLQVFRIRPLLGADFPADAYRVGGPNRLVIISHALWQSRFGGDPTVVNRPLRLDGIDYTIVGVLPPHALPRNDVAFLRPLALEDPAKPWRMDPMSPWAVVVARMKPGVTPAQLSAEMSRIHTNHLAQFPAPARPFVPMVIPMHEQFTGAMRPTLLMLSIAGALVLLIACANVANLLLVRAIARRREFAVRIALGASPGWIVRQTLGESFLLALLGAVVAVLVASYCTGFLGSVAVAVQPQLNGLQRHIADMLMGGELPLMLQPRVDWTVLGFSLAVAAVTTVLFGLVPALRACRADLLQDLKEGRGSSGLRPRLQSLLVAGQVGVTAVLLISAGLFLRSFSKVLAVDPGFDAQHTIAFSLATPGTRYPNPERVVHFVDDVETRLVGLPGVEAVGTTTNVPFRSQSVSAVGLTTAPDREHDILTFHDYVGGDLFRALGVPLRRGRVFTPADNMTGAQRVVILTEKLARDLFHEQDPIGQPVFWDRQTWTVVGLVQDVRMVGLDVEGNEGHHLYAPSIQRPAPAAVIVRTRGSPAAILESIRRTVRALDPDQPLSDLQPLAQDIGRSLDGTRTNLALVLAFAAVALALACVGIYGVLAFVVGQRERELGIRLALGAPQKGVLAMVLRDGLLLVLPGLAVGLLAAIAGGRLIASFLFGVSAHDPVVFATVGALLTAAAAAACLLPARRATKVDPMIALRAE